MFEKIKERIFPFIIALSALSVSASAAFYSVSGLMKLFAGAAFAVGVMATSLEVSKLVIASLLYQYWSTLNKALKIYLMVAVSILILITSMGIYGFLSSAYQETANKDQVVTQQITALETKKKLYEGTRDNILKEKQSLSDLRGSLSKGSTTQYTDSKGNLVVRSNNASIKQLDKASQSDDKLSSKIDIVNDSIFSIENKILAIKTSSTSSSELGPLKYLSGLTGIGMDSIINYLLLVIIFVFDPLAIALVIAANFAFTRLNKREEIPLEEKVEDMRNVVDAYDDLQDEIKEYEIYKEQDKTSILEPILTNVEEEWIIEDEDNTNPNINEEFIKSLDKINQINDGNEDFFWKKARIDEEINRIKAYEQSLKQKKQDEDENNKDKTKIYF
tara:strand:+ start:255 stop:1421 length:1167 start_codon:yes stop_codon:yes gene_type:complete